MGSATSSVKTSILSDPGLVIDTENYDPTEPTNDNDSADEESSQVSAPSPQVISLAPSTCARALAPRCSRGPGTIRGEKYPSGSRQYTQYERLT